MSSTLGDISPPFTMLWLANSPQAIMHTICDGSAIITGVLLAFNLPSNLPIWIIILGALFAIGVGKMSFGGLGCNPFNPALAGRVFLLLSFPVQMTSWPVVGQLTAYTDATTGATPLALMKHRGCAWLPGCRRSWR